MNSSNDTNARHTVLPTVQVGPISPPSLASASVQAASELVTQSAKIAPRANLKPLLKVLDGIFASLMDKSLSVQARNVAKAEGDQQQAPPTIDSTSIPFQDGPNPEMLQERDRYIESLQQAPQLHSMVLPSAAESAAANSSIIRRGLGAPLFIGFDAEWKLLSMGRNRLLSVQFYIYGPTGETFTNVLEFVGPRAENSRPSLAEALSALLDEAEEACVFEEWPSEVVLCGHFVRADLPVFRDFKQFRHQLKGINGTLATVGKPVSLKLSMSDEQSERLKSRYSYVLDDNFDPRWLSVRIVDSSRLVAPGTSAEKLGDWLGVRKISLPSGYLKSEMDRFQRERPEQFREYGLRDAQISVLFVLWTMWFCDRYLGMTDQRKLPVTASGISVRLAQMCMRKDGVHPDVALNFEKVRQLRWDALSGRATSTVKRLSTRTRRWFESFLADAYLGGRNECYWFGPTPIQNASGERKLFDHDLAAAYLNCLVWVMALDYDGIELVKDIERFRGLTCGVGYAEVVFEFPAETRFPCLPVVMEKYGLWFPLKGVSLATSPEIELALDMGANISEVRFGVIIPWKSRDMVFAASEVALRKGRKAANKKNSAVTEATLLQAKGESSEDGTELFEPVVAMQFPPESHGDAGYRPYESFAIYTRLMRLRYRRKTLPHEFMKLVGNGAYGKSGQGFKGKKGLEMQNLSLKPIGPSAISEAAIAAMVSGFARAVLGEILWKLPADAMVVSVTTDGLLVDLEKLDLTGTACTRFQGLVDRVAPGTGMTELKHMIVQCVAAKTRLQLTGKVALDEKGQPMEPVVAKGGIKVPLDIANGDEAAEVKLKSPVGQNQYVLDLMVNRYPGQIIRRENLMGMKYMLENGYDLTMIDRDIRLNMEYDFKRRPVSPLMVTIESHGVEHLAFDTVPWDTVLEGELARTLFDRWRIGNAKAVPPVPGHCLKTMQEWQDWQQFYQHYSGNRVRAQAFKALQDQTDDVLPSTAGIGPNVRAKVVRGVSGMRYLTSKSDYLGAAIRTFLAAYVQRAWGLADVDLSQSQLAAWLTGVGYPVKVHDVKNAGRTKLYENSVVSHPDVLAFFGVVCARFLGLELTKFMAP